MSKYDAQLAVYQPKPTLWQKTKKHATNASLALAVGVSSVPAFAAIDTTELVTEIGGNKAGMNSVGMALLGLLVLVVGFGMVRRMMR